MDFINIIKDYIYNIKIEQERLVKERLEKERFEKEKERFEKEKERLKKERIEKENKEKEIFEKELLNKELLNSNNNYNKISLINFNIKYLDSIIIDFFNYLSNVHDGRLYYLGITLIFISLIYFIVKFIIIIKN
jgi:tRNA U34 5-carboxymethylaminomethyl modifying enzyme MnmG/GidA